MCQARAGKHRSRTDRRRSATTHRRIALAAPVPHTSIQQSSPDAAMTLTIPKDRPRAQARVLEGLAHLRALFPLEQRIHAAPQPVRAAYARVLAHWLRATPPSAAAFDTNALAALAKLDAVVPGEQGLGCYPFSSIDTGIRVTLPGGAVDAMCAIDALAIARLARAPIHIESNCVACGSAIACRVEENGGLDHDQVEMARVVWQHAVITHGSCSQGLC